MARKPRAPGAKVDVSLLSAAEIEAIKTKARAAADKELKAKQEEALYEATLDDARRSNDPAETLFPVYLDLAPHANQITLDGRVYFHGHTVHVNYGVKCALKDIIARSWEHEAEVGGVNRDRYRPSRGLTISPNGVTGVAGVTTAARMAGGL